MDSAISGCGIAAPSFMLSASAGLGGSLLLGPALALLLGAKDGVAHASVQSGTPIETADWTTLGFATLDDVRVGFPRIAAFTLGSDKLPPPSNLAGNDHHCEYAVVAPPGGAPTVGAVEARAIETIPATVAPALHPAGT